MSLGVPARLGIFAAGLAVAFGAAAALGAGVHPGPARPARRADERHEGHGRRDGRRRQRRRLHASRPPPSRSTRGQPATLSFRIVDRDGDVVRDGFQIEAERRLHLIIARRDLTGYQHLHPTEAVDGTWSTPITMPHGRCLPRVRRLPARRRQARARGRPDRARHLPAEPAARARGRRATTEGFTVTLSTKQLRAGKEGDLDFTVPRDGRPVAGIEPYLGARGHLVALREGDLAYLHVHPHDGEQPAGVVPFSADFASAGSYRLFLQFQVEAPSTPPHSRSR